jgi:hypothetical protein
MARHEMWMTPVSSERANRTNKIVPSVENGTHGQHLSAQAVMWQTPTVNDSKNNAAASQHERNSPALNVQAATWPTPRAADATKGSGESPKRDGGPSLTTVSAQWPTPTAMDSRSSGAAHYSTESGRHSGTTLTDAIRSHPDPATPPDGADGSNSTPVLNPRFVEALMGWPDRWTIPSPTARIDWPSWETEWSRWLALLLCSYSRRAPWPVPAEAVEQARDDGGGE